MQFNKLIQQTFLSLSLTLGFGLTVLMPLSASAAQTAISAGFDARVQKFKYDPRDVFIVNAKVGYSTLVQLEQGEFIEEYGGLGMGDAQAWSLAVRGNNIFFKPIRDLPDTNMIIVTNRRTYAFQLTTSDPIPTYIARFDYPAQDTGNGFEPPKLPAVMQKVGKDKEGRDILIDIDINTNYFWRGEKALKPTNAWDDGRFTMLKFAHASDLPAVYRVMPDNSEMLVNTHITGDTMIIQEIGSVYRLRLGKAVTEIGNGNIRLPDFNETGTSDDNFVRIDQ